MSAISVTAMYKVFGFLLATITILSSPIRLMPSLDNRSDLEQLPVLLIASRAGLPHIRIHDLRHTHAVLMREAGLSLDDIKDDLGHKDISTTQIYAEISPAKKKENHQQFEKYLNQ